MHLTVRTKNWPRKDLSQPIGERSRLAASLALFFLTAATAHANLSLVAEIGAPAADFPPGFIYWNVENPVIGAGGHVAFIGAADVSIGSTAQNTAAVWTGLPGQLHTAIRQGESPAGFPPSVVLDFVYPRYMAVSDSGSVAFTAQMAGSNPGTALSG